MPPFLTFLLGLAVLALFGWYFTTDNGLHKRWLGLVLTVSLILGALVTVYPPDKKIQLGLDLQGGTEFLIRLVKENPEARISPQSRDTAVEVIRSRVDQYGTSEPSITPVGEDSILVQIPGLDAQKINDMRNTLQRVAKLEFKLVDPQGAAIISRVEAGQDIVPPGYQIVAGEDEENEAVTAPKPSNDKKAPPATKKQVEKLLVKNTADMGGEHITSANPSYSQGGAVEVQVRFDSTGAQQFGRGPRLDGQLLGPLPQALGEGQAGLGERPLDGVGPVGQGVGQVEHRPVDGGPQALDMPLQGVADRASAVVEAGEQRAAPLLDGSHQDLGALGEAAGQGLAAGIHEGAQGVDPPLEPGPEGLGAVVDQAGQGRLAPA